MIKKLFKSILIKLMNDPEVSKAFIDIIRKDIRARGDLLCDISSVLNFSWRGRESR